MIRIVSVFVFLAATAAVQARDSGGAVDRAAQAQISPQPLADALTALARQSGLQLIYGSEAVRGRQSRGAPAGLSMPQLLAHILKGTGLEYEFLNERTVTIWIKGHNKPVAGAKQPQAAAGRISDTLRVANAQPAQRDVASALTERPQGEDGRGVPEILVRGSRSANTDIRRTEDDVQPYVVFETEEIRRSMAGTLEEFLLQRLPMNTSEGTGVQDPGSPFGDFSGINLRGLGTDETLILVNGRRMPGFSYGSSSPGQADINGIPMSAVKRVEVLPSTAGGIYGGGATGGVINIILRDDYRGIEFNGNYQNAFDTDAADRRFSLSGGFAFAEGRTQVNLNLSHASSTSLLAQDRGFIQRAREMAYDNNRSAFTTLTGATAGATSNIRSTNGQPLVLADGNVSLGHAYTHVPYGYAGIATDNGAALFANAGEYNLDLPFGPAGAERSLTTTPTREAVTLNIRQRVNDRFEMFLDGSYNRTESINYISGIGSRIVTLQPGAPNNPFVGAVRVNFPGSDFRHGARQAHWSSSLSVGVGAIARLPRDWSAQGEFAFGRSTRDTTSGSSVVKLAELNAALADGTLDVMRDTNAYPLDYSDFYYTPLPSNYYIDPFATETRSYSLRLAGPTVHLPAGPLMVSGLLTRHETMMEPSLNVIIREPIDYNYTPDREQNTDSYYVEATMPLFSGKNGFRGMRGLDLQVSYRNDRTRTRTLADFLGGIIDLPGPDAPIPPVEYNTSAVTADQYTLGLRYSPLPSLALRASYGRGVRPPSMTELVPTLTTNFTPFGTLDPRRMNEPVPAIETYSLFGFPGLQPEQSASVSAGVIFKPAFLRGLRLSVDYTLIEKTDEIALISTQQILDQEAFFSDHIIRNPLTDEDRLDGYEAGTIREFYSGTVNLARTRAESFDVQLDYSWDSGLGTFNANLLATAQPDLVQQVQADAAAINFVGYAGGVVKWRGNAGLTWEHRAWTAGWNMQYYNHYLVYGATASTSLRNTSIANQGSDTIPSQLYHDMFVRYRFAPNSGFARGLLANAELMVGIGNVFDTEPPLIATTSATSRGYSAFGNPRLRRYTISLTRSFD